MTREPDFAAYHVASVRDGGYNPAQPGDLTIHDDVTTYIYRGIEPQHHAAFFDWATGLFTGDKDTPHRLAGSAEAGWHVEAGFSAPQPIPDDDTDEYQVWLDGPCADALRSWENEDRPNE